MENKILYVTKNSVSKNSVKIRCQSLRMGSSLRLTLVIKSLRMGSSLRLSKGMGSSLCLTLDGKLEE
jgi:hypothetical protein